MGEERGLLRFRKSAWAALGIALLCCALLYFLPSGEETGEEDAYPPTQLEARLEAVLSRVEGAGRVKCMIREEEGVIAGVLIVAEGAKDISVRLCLQSAVCTLLGVENAKISVVEMEKTVYEAE